MAKGKLILICQSGGEFVRNEDGTMLYNGGEANAANVTPETPFNDLKLDLAEICNFNQETVTIKYFLPGNKRNLITVKNDKDVRRMIDFHGDAITADVFVSGTTGFLPTPVPVEIQINRENDNMDTEEDEAIKQGKVGTKKDKKVKKEQKVAKIPLSESPAKRTRRAVALLKTEASSRENESGKTDSQSEGDTSTSTDSKNVSENVDSDCSSDFVPPRYPKRKSRNEADFSASSADSVKKRRRSVNGQPSIDSVRSKSRGKRQKAIDGSSSDRKSERIADKVIATELLHASDKEAYNKLPWFCEKIIETNPGSISKLVIGEKKRFKSLFVSFYASLYGFQNGCRPLLFLEATSLRSRYGEVLLTANAIDGNNGFFPVAFGIVDVDDYHNWRWFLEELKSAILISQPITFVIDFEKNSEMSVVEVFEDAYVGYSIYHLLESLKRNTKGPSPSPFHGDSIAFLPDCFLEAAHAVRPVGFRKSMDQIKQISSQAYDWVMQIEPRHWATSFFNGEPYNHIINDVGGSLSRLMEDSRELPILHKIDALIRTMIETITDAKLDASLWSTHLTPLKEKQLQDEKLRSYGLKVLISSDTLFEVREDSTHVVDISSWSCTCLKWKETGIPCRHAVSVFTQFGKNLYDFCSNYFTVDTYRITYTESITPVPISNDKIETEEEKGENLETMNAGDRKEEGEEEKAENLETKNAGDQKEGGEEEKGEKTEMQIAETEEEKIEVENEDDEKVGGENGKIREEHEYPNVLVLPPVPAKPVDLVKEKTEWEETEVEMKRTVTCTKCKQPGHNKKSCKL